MKINEQAHFKTRFDSYDASYMELRTGANGDMFDCVWQPDNVNFDGDGLSLKIDRDANGGTGGEWRTREYFHYGLYQVRTKAIKNTGVVTSFFTYTGPTDGTKWDEIDIEFPWKRYDKSSIQLFYRWHWQS